LSVEGPEFVALFPGREYGIEMLSRQRLDCSINEAFGPQRMRDLKQYHQVGTISVPLFKPRERVLQHAG